MTIKTKLEEQAAAATASAPAALAAGLGTIPLAGQGAVQGAVQAAHGATQEAVQATANAASTGMNRTVAAMNDSMTQTAAGLKQTQARMNEGMSKAMKTAEEFVAFGQGNFEALVKSGQIWAAGMQDLGKQVAATAQAQFEETVSAFKAIAGAKSVKDALDVQATLARTTMEKALAESGRFTETSMKLTEQALAPVTARASVAVEKFGRAG